jgi:hypothetical protein
MKKSLGHASLGSSFKEQGSQSRKKRGRRHYHHDFEHYLAHRRCDLLRGLATMSNYDSFIHAIHEGSSFRLPEC